MENEIYEYIDELSDAEKISLLLIGETNKIKSTRLQKLALIVHSLKKGKIEIEHGAYLFGGLRVPNAWPGYTTGAHTRYYFFLFNIFIIKSIALEMFELEIAD